MVSPLLLLNLTGILEIDNGLNRDKLEDSDLTGNTFLVVSCAAFDSGLVRK